MSSTQRALTPEDVLGFKNVEDAQISPDGTQVAFVVGDSFKVDSKWPKSTIWMVSHGRRRTATVHEWPSD